MNLERGIVVDLALNDIYISAFELLGDFLLRCGLVAHKANDNVVRVGRELAEKLKLYVRLATAT